MELANTKLVKTKLANMELANTKLVNTELANMKLAMGCSS